MFLAILILHLLNIELKYKKTKTKEHEKNEQTFFATSPLHRSVKYASTR
jgi:hypothetical protein